MIDLVASLSLDDRLSGALKKLGAVAGFASIGVAAKSAVSKFAEFDTAIRSAGAISGATDAEFEQLRQTALELGAATTQSATSSAEALTELAAGGFTATQAIAALPGVIAAAEASGESLAVASGVVSSALSIFSIDAAESGRVADVLSQSANQSAAGIQDLGFAFQYAGPVAAQLGISIEELAAATGILANNGIQGSSAGTALRGAISRLNSPVGKAADVMSDLGINVKDSNGELLGLSGIVAEVGRALEGQTESQKNANLTTILGQEAVSGFLALISAGPAELDRLSEGLRNSGGASAETAEKIQGGIGGALEQLSGAIETFQIEVGDALSGVVTDVANFVANIDTDTLVENITDAVDKAVEIGQFIIDNWRPIAGVFAGITAAVIAFRIQMGLLSIVGVATTLINAYRNGTLLATASQLIFNSALLANPIGLIIVAISVLIGIIVFLALNWDSVTATVKKAWEAIGGGEGFISIILGPLGFLINAAIDLAKNWDSTKSIWENVWAAIRSSAETSVNAAIGLINGLIKAINSIPFVNIKTIDNVDFTPENNNRNGSPNGSKTPKRSFHGLESVPYNGYQATLHRNERVLTAQENKQLQNNGTIGGAGGGNVTVTGNTFNVRQDSDIEAIAYRLAKLIEGERAQIG